MLHTYELGIVSMEKFIDTLSLSHSLLAGETVNCCQHVEDLIAIEDSRYRNRSKGALFICILYITFRKIVMETFITLNLHFT